MSLVTMDREAVVMLRVVVIGVVVDVRTREWTRGNDGQDNQRDHARAEHMSSLRRPNPTVNGTTAFSRR